MKVVLFPLFISTLFSVSDSFLQSGLKTLWDSKQTFLMSQTGMDGTVLTDQIALMSERIEMLTRENAQLKAAAISPGKSLAITYPSLPTWFEDIKKHSDCSVVDDTVREWNDEHWRLSEGGFSGTDYVHSRSRAPVRVLEYLLIKPSTGSNPSTDINDGLFYPSLVGPAFFSGAAESHKGLCHGGSMCALMDDAIGWMGFCISGRPREWTGYTVQIDTSLKKSVAVGSILKLEAWIERREGARKIWICSKLSDPNDGTLHCSARGLFLMSPEALVDDNAIPSDSKNKKSKL